MFSFSVLFAIYCLLIVLASLLGGRLPSLVQLNHRQMQTLISFVGGLMLGIGLLHLLPHAVAHLKGHSSDQVVIPMLLGILVMFFLLRTFHFHHHDPEQVPHLECDHHDHHHEHGDQLAADMSWAGVFVGLSLHTLIDGFALGASMQADALHGNSSWFLGIGTFVAILLHKPLDALSITALMRGANWPSRSQIAVNLAFSLMCPLGALLFLGGAAYLVEQQVMITGNMLAFSAGVFLCISLSDLLPEMEFHSHHRIRLSIALLLGILLAWSIRLLEPSQAHAAEGLEQMVHPFLKLPA